MNKAALLRMVNLLFFILFVIQVFTGLAMLFRVPVPGGPEVHAVNGIVFVALTGVHVALNWVWVRANYLKQRKP